MDSDSRLPWIVTGILLLLAAFFALTETAISSVSRNKIKIASDRGDPRADRVLYVLDNFERAITTLLICTNLVHLSAAALVTVAVTKRWGSSALTLSTLLTTLAVFFFGEMLPKSLGKKKSEQFSLGCCGILKCLMTVFAPLAKLLSSLGLFVSRFSKGDPDISVTEDELYDIIEDMTEEGTLDEEEGDLISSALQFGDVTVDSILTPRVDLDAVDRSDSPEEILDICKKTNHSRLPVYDESIDSIAGVLQIRKYIKAYLKDGHGTVLDPLLDEVLYVHQSTKIDDLLDMLIHSKVNMAVVTDNYGGTVGVVTVEDILEELVGEIWDEDDVVEENIIPLGDNLWLVDAEETVSDVLDRLDYEDPEENEELVNTQMGEWAYEQFSVIPHPGESFSYHRLQVTVAEMDHNRILKLRAALLPEEAEGGEEA